MTAPPVPAAVVGGAVTLSLGQLLDLSTADLGSTPPACVVVCALDRNEYTAGSPAATGSLAGGGHTLPLTPIGGDGRGAGIVFTWAASSGQYVNPTYGTLAALAYTASASPGDVTSISLFSAASTDLAQYYANNAYGLIAADPSGYVSSATIVTDPAFQGPAFQNPVIQGTMPRAATPDGIAQSAERFVGDAWNADGCWVLASTISAECGASLPVQSTDVATPGANNGEWFTLYDGPVSANPNWQSLVGTGDMVVFAPAGGGGHITTCVSGSGSTAQLVDNIEYLNPNGSVANPAHDGSLADIAIAAPHAASQEFAGVAASSVVIYALDTPVVAPSAAPVQAVPSKPLALSTFVYATDPEQRAITAYQLYDSAPGATVASATGSPVSVGHTAASALTVTSLAGLTVTYAQPGTDTVQVHACNGAYWGDWQSFAVTAAPLVALPPVLARPTPNQLWAQSSQATLKLSAGTFTDPQGGKLTYTASLATGAALPAWLLFAPTTLTFTATVPAGLATMSIALTATDTAGLSTTEIFAVATKPAAPTLAQPTAHQNWTEGGHVVLALPPNIFSDPQNEPLTFKATLATGAALPAWLQFNPATTTFSRHSAHHRPAPEPAPDRHRHQRAVGRRQFLRQHHRRRTRRHARF